MMDSVERAEFLTPKPARALAGLLGVEPPDFEIEGAPAHVALAPPARPF